MRTSVEGLVVVITGASRGIGRATARLSAECEAMSARALVVPTDVADWEAVEGLARRSVERFGRIDVWVNNAVLAAVGRLEEVPPETNRQVVEANLLGYVYGAQATLPHFREQ